MFWRKWLKQACAACLLFYAFQYTQATLVFTASLKMPSSSARLPIACFTASVSSGVFSLSAMYLREIGELAPALVVVPSVLIQNWIEEINKFGTTDSTEITSSVGSSGGSSSGKSGENRSSINWDTQSKQNLTYQTEQSKVTSNEIPIEIEKERIPEIIEIPSNLKVESESKTTTVSIKQNKSNTINILNNSNTSSKAVEEVKSIELEPIKEELTEVKPIEVEPIVLDPIEAELMEIKPIEVEPITTALKEQPKETGNSTLKTVGTIAAVGAVVGAASFGAHSLMKAQDDIDIYEETEEDD